ncbi:MAG: hypothetical protein ACM3Y9_15455 [Ignavibacteria bacterium]
MDQQNENSSDKAKTGAERRAEARRHLIFGIVAAVVITALIAMMFIIDEYGQSRMPNAHLQAPHDAADKN